MIAVIYSGSKTAFWKLYAEDKIVAETSTQGLNPYFNEEKQIFSFLNKNTTLINNAEKIKKIYAFVAGARTKSAQHNLREILEKFFTHSKIKIKDDLYGASIAACHHKSGIVGILGSGANCAYFNGKSPQENNFGLGYILADEGSSNYLGKILLKNFLEEKIPDDLKTKLESKYSLDRPSILERIYKRPNVQSYLSSFFDFFVENRKHKFIEQIIDQGFEKFLETYIKPTRAKHQNEEIHFVGSVAGTFQDRLRLVAQKHNIDITSITKEPIHNILHYYTN